NNNVTRVRQLLEECPRGLRAWEWQYLKHLDRAELQTFRLDDRSWVIAPSPDATKIITGSEDARIEIRDAATGRYFGTLHGRSRSVVGSASIQRQEAASALSLDGKLLVPWIWCGYDAPPEVKVWDLAAGREVLALEGITGYVTATAISPDRRLL